MQFRKFITGLCFLGALLIGIMFALEFIMFRAAARWAEQGFEIPAYQRNLYSLAVFWSRFWWLGCPLVVVFLLFCALVFFLVRHSSYGPATDA